MYFIVRHTTRFRYSLPITESIMEVHLQPRSEGNQHCLDFRLRTSPMSQIYSYRGEDGNWVHHFDVPNRHTHLTITAEAKVEVLAPPPLPESLSPNAWNEIDALTAEDDYWYTIHPSHFARPGEPLSQLIEELQIERRDDPLTVVRDITTSVNTTFEYAKQNTHVHSPIDDALRIRRGVCQDFAHIMIALVRSLGIPARYVSGYLYHEQEYADRSTTGATHAWVETLLPGLGWVGFDPTNNMPAGDRHIRVAIGRDYADVPPTHGVFHGKAESELAVTVLVYPAESQSARINLEPEAEWEPAPARMSEEGVGSFFQQGTEAQQQ